MKAVTLEVLTTTVASTSRVNLNKVETLEVRAEASTSGISLLKAETGEVRAEASTSSVSRGQTRLSE